MKNHDAVVAIINGHSFFIEVSFIGNYFDQFDATEEEERIDSEYRFALAIAQLINMCIVPTRGDWIEPLAREDYPLDTTIIDSVTYYVKGRQIQFRLGYN